MVRLKDIAQRLGVSVMTVSKALRDAPDVSAATKAKIKSLAAQMGYVPDSSAQGLRTKTTKLFGVVIPSITNPIFARIIFAIEERAHDLGYDVLLAHSLNKPEREEHCIRHLLSRRVDGLFISPVYRFEAEARIYQEILTRKTPTVLLGSPALFCKNFPSVEIEEAIASYNVTQHLLKLGHKLVFQSGSTIEDGTKAALQMLNENCHATAVQAVNDLVAIGCADALLSQGLKIPDDISITGFGNILLTEHFRVPLTTVRQPKFRLGIAAVEMMMSLIRGESVQSKRLPAELVERKSSAPPKS
jgi:DNA-binding LacI/PurR family transcriptional regulator